ncbi:RTA1-domain-containing protein [Auricularia subglabra TFB-10046 SS5]|uniref:RTA1-domain-containing protein n=1 Tax=Auricularia subglabra (strain TFB-10046 / SS5) TaxID=717982 RepID=J0WYW5_AURST|nr:RTA1-domain-containing protein [Auricularia subglabra TFB-10046 SS5]
MSNLNSTIPPPGDPFADPEHDLYNPLKYIPSDTLTAISTAIVLVVGISQVFLTFKHKAKWMMVMTLGCFTFAIGLAARFPFARDPHSKNIFIVEYLLVVLSPCAFIAGTYVVLGRIARYLRCDKYLLIRPTRVTLVFVTADILTFLIQALGGTLVVSDPGDVDKVKLGGNLFKIGFILQVLSFAFFCLLVVIFATRVRNKEPSIWTADADAQKPWHSDWRALLGALIVACITVMVRSIYRMAESLEGAHGKLAITEWIFYAFDVLPLCICVATFVPFWPPRFIHVDAARVGAAMKPVPLAELGPYNDSQVPLVPQNNAWRAV